MNRAKYLNAFAFETLHVNKSTPLTKELFLNAEEAWITLQGSDIRYRYDGEEPESGIGHILHSGHSLRLQGNNQITNFKACSCTPDIGILSVSYERE